MWETLEIFLARHQHTVAAVEAASTFAAVVVSLAIALLAQRTSRTRLRATADLNVIAHSTIDPTNPPSYVVASITNLGVMPLRVPLSFFVWKVPFDRGGWPFLPLDYSALDAWAQQRRYPFEVNPRASETFFLSDRSTFRETFGRVFEKTDLISRFRYRFLKAIVVTDDGKTFPVRIEKGLRAEIDRLRNGAPVAQPEEWVDRHPSDFMED